MGFCDSDNENNSNRTIKNDVPASIVTGNRQPRFLQLSISLMVSNGDVVDSSLIDLSTNFVKERGCHDILHSYYDIIKRRENLFAEPIDD